MFAPRKSYLSIQVRFKRKIFLIFLYFPLLDLNIKLSLPADCNAKRGFTSKKMSLISFKYFKFFELLKYRIKRLANPEICFNKT